MTSRQHWSPNARRIGIASAIATLVIGFLYVAVIVSWLIVEAVPGEPIGDPYLALMEVLTIISALALLGLVSTLLRFVNPGRRVFARIAFALGTLGAGLTMTVHFVQLTAVRQLWRAGQLSDYRLIWPSPIFAAEYFAWDVLIGLAMIAAALALTGSSRARAARLVLLWGGIFCVVGVVGPASGEMLLQNIAVFGYALLLPVGAGLLAVLFRNTAADSAADSVPDRSPAESRSVETRDVDRSAGGRL